MCECMCARICVLLVLLRLFGSHCTHLTVDESLMQVGPKSGALDAELVQI